MKNKKKIAVFFILSLVVIIMTSCLPGGGNYNPGDPAGFFSGVWHGWIAPFSLILSLFNESISIYEPNNTGWWYEFGFYISIISGFGGIQFFRKKKS